MAEATAASVKRHFDYKKTFVVGFGFLGISIIWPIFNQYIPIFLQAGNPAFETAQPVRGFGLGPALALFIMTWDNLLNVFIQPWVGNRSDRTWTRFGRRKPWILIGVPIAVVGFTLIPFAQTAVAIAAFILITNVGMALFRSPTVSWLGDLYDPADRSKANGIINLMGGLGGLLAFFGGGLLFNTFIETNPEMARVAPFIGGAILLIVVMIVPLFGVKEPEQITLEAEEENTSVWTNVRTILGAKDKSQFFVLLGILLWFMGFNALEAGLSSFAVFSLGLTPGTASIFAGLVAVSFMLFAIPAGLLGTKYGRQRIIQVGLIGLILILAVAYFLIQGSVTFVVALIITGLFWAFVNVNSLPLVYDYGDENRIGAYTGLYYFSSQSAAVLGPTLGGIVISQLGNEYRWLFPFAAVFMVLAWVAIKQVRVIAQTAVS